MGHLEAIHELMYLASLFDCRSIVSTRCDGSERADCTSSIIVVLFSLWSLAPSDLSANEHQHLSHQLD